MKKRILIGIGILLLLIAGYFIFQFSVEKIKNIGTNEPANQEIGSNADQKLANGINQESLPPVQTSEINTNQETQSTNQDQVNSGEIIKESVMQNIEIKGFAFNPETLTIKQGDSVTWTNKDSARHTVTSDTESELDSDLLSKDNTYVHVFNEKGEFSYHCKPHPYMTGKIIVE